VCFVSETAEAATNLKPFDPVALQSVVEATAKELLLPGAMVLLLTPRHRANFAFANGATELGRKIPPRADTHFRVAYCWFRWENCVSTIPFFRSFWPKGLTQFVLRRSPIVALVPSL
jgi:hypothetical protein